MIRPRTSDVVTGKEELSGRVLAGGMCVWDCQGPSLQRVKSTERKVQVMHYRIVHLKSV